MLQSPPSTIGNRPSPIVFDADDFGRLEQSMQTGFPERVGGVLHSARMESESGRHLDDSELSSRPRGQSMPALGAYLVDHGRAWITR
jgi:hypothetical protein